MHKIHKIALVTDDIEETVRFYTQTKTVTQRWPDDKTQVAAFNIPLME